MEQAVYLDAACVVVDLLQSPDQPDLRRQCVEDICCLEPDYEQYGLSLMIEPF